MPAAWMPGVLGCTHFPFARRAIRAALGGNVTLYDGSDGTARETLRQLVRRGWVRGGSHGVVTLENSLPSEAAAQPPAARPAPGGLTA